MQAGSNINPEADLLVESNFNQNMPMTNNEQMPQELDEEDVENMEEDEDNAEETINFQGDTQISRFSGFNLTETQILY